MSTKDTAINTINLMNEEQLAGFVTLFRGLVSEIHNDETVAAMRESEEMLNDPNAPRFATVADLFEELRS